jgi:uncharacterized protein YndB with AHSA1/START domain
MSERRSVDVVVERLIPAPPERVFAAWIDPVVASTWLFRTPAGEIIRAEFDASPGGEFAIVERREDEDIVHAGEFEEIEAPHRLVFVFSLDQFRTANRVTVEIEPAPEGSRLKLTHELDSQWAAFADRTREGWALMLDGLEKALA